MRWTRNKREFWRHLTLTVKEIRQNYFVHLSSTGSYWHGLLVIESNQNENSDGVIVIPDENSFYKTTKCSSYSLRRSRSMLCTKKIQWHLYCGCSWNLYPLHGCFMGKKANRKRNEHMINRKTKVQHSRRLSRWKFGTIWNCIKRFRVVIHAGTNSHT